MPNCLFALGFLALVAGVMLLSIPAGLIVAGVLFAAWGALMLETVGSSNIRVISASPRRRLAWIRARSAASAGSSRAKASTA